METIGPPTDPQKNQAGARFCPKAGMPGTLSRAPEYWRMNLADTGMTPTVCVRFYAVLLRFLRIRRGVVRRHAMLQLRNNAAIALAGTEYARRREALALLPRAVTIALTTPARSVSEMTPGLGDFCLDIFRCDGPVRMRRVVRATLNAPRGALPGG